MATKKHTKPEATGEVCPVEAIARRQVGLWEAFMAAAERGDNNDAARVQDAMDANLVTASWQYPTSDIGAMFQIGNAIEAVGDMIENEMPPADQAVLLRRARRCLFGAIRVMEQRVAMPCGKLHIDAMSGDQCDEILMLARLVAKDGGVS